MENGLTHRGADFPKFEIFNVMLDKSTCVHIDCISSFRAERYSLCIKLGFKKQNFTQVGGLKSVL